jgi:hypothetical protein
LDEIKPAASTNGPDRFTSLPGQLGNRPGPLSLDGGSIETSLSRDHQIMLIDELIQS